MLPYCKDVFHLFMKNMEDKYPRDNNGSTPLHYAVRRGISVCRMMIEQLEKINQTNSAGKTPLQLNLEMKNNKGKTPLDEACDFDHFDVIDFIKMKRNEKKSMKRKLKEETEVQKQTQNKKKRRCWLSPKKNRSTY